MSCRSWGVCVVLLWAWLGVASADGPPTMLRGRVTDVLGQPIGGARVYVLARTGGREETKTTKDGRYAITLERGGAYGVVIAVDDVHTYRTVLVEPGASTTLDVEVETDIGGGEVINIVDKRPKTPKVPAKPKQPPRQALPYSEEAVERDAWAKAWLLLDVDATGRVTRLKLLKAPGFDLDRIAIEEGLKLRFDPARDDAGRPVRTYVVYAMEWPAWGWVIQGNGVAMRPNDVDDLHAMSKTNAQTRLRDDIVPVGPGLGQNIGRAYWAAPVAVSFSHSLERVPCAGSGPLNLDLRNRAYRDCSRYDLSQVDALPWITRATVDTAIADLATKRATLIEIPGPPPSRIPDVIATVATGALVAGLVVSHLRFSNYDREAYAIRNRRPVDWDAVEQTLDQRHRWSNIRTGLAAATIISGAVTIFLWTRNAPKSSFSVQPTDDGSGGAASFGMSF